jgi:hypothetical protein
MVVEYSRRFAVRRDAVFDGDDFRQLHGFVRVVCGTDGQWRAAFGQDVGSADGSEMLFEIFSASPMTGCSRRGALYFATTIPCHVPGGNIKCCQNQSEEVPKIAPGSRLEARCTRLKEAMDRESPAGFDSENPDHQRMIDEELAQMLADSELLEDYHAMLGSASSRVPCPRACAAAGCLSARESKRGCAAKGLRIWCHKCDVACYCSPECKQEHRYNRRARTHARTHVYTDACERCWRLLLLR